MLYPFALLIIHSKLTIISKSTYAKLVNFSTKIMCYESYTTAADYERCISIFGKLKKQQLQGVVPGAQNRIQGAGNGGQEFLFRINE